MPLNGADDELGRWSAEVEGVLHANPWFSILQQAVIMRKYGVKLELWDNLKATFGRGPAKPAE